MTGFYIATDILLILVSKHPDRGAVLERMREWLSRGDVPVTSTATISEINQVFLERDKLKHLRNFWNVMGNFFDEVRPVEKRDLERALDIEQEYAIGYGRAVHAAFFLNHGINCMFTSDPVFDRVAGIKRAYLNIMEGT